MISALCFVLLFRFNELPINWNGNINPTFTLTSHTPLKPVRRFHRKWNLANFNVSCNHDQLTDQCQQLASRTHSFCWGEIFHCPTQLCMSMHQSSLATWTCWSHSTSRTTDRCACHGCTSDIERIWGYLDTVGKNRRVCRRLQKALLSFEFLKRK